MTVSAEESLRFNTSIASTFAISNSEYWKSYEPKSITDLKFEKKKKNLPLKLTRRKTFQTTE